MQRLLATGTVLAAVSALLASPAPGETRKPAAFPAGHYVLAGAGEPALGGDVYEFTKTFRLKPGQYVLSGGAKPTDLIVVDDDLEVHQDGKKLFVDDDHVASTERRGKQAAAYQGQPIVLVLDPSKKFRIVVIDHGATDAIVGELYLHRWDGARKKLTEGRREQSAPTLPNTFFDESYTLTEGFELPEKVATGGEVAVPEKPATLLPRFKPAAPPPAAPKPPVAADFIKKAITEGLEEDGVPITLASELGKRDDFLGKCTLCQPSRLAITEYSNRKCQPAAKENKGLPEELLNRLRSDKAEVRQPALRELVGRYMDRAFAKNALTADQSAALQKDLDQSAALQKDLEQMRKNQVNSLPSDRKFCPSCDGACRIGLKP
jgi:hypothetical protein